MADQNSPANPAPGPPRTPPRPPPALTAGQRSAINKMNRYRGLAKAAMLEGTAQLKSASQLKEASMTTFTELIEAKARARASFDPIQATYEEIQVAFEDTPEHPSCVKQVRIYEDELKQYAELVATLGNIASQVEVLLRQKGVDATGTGIVLPREPRQDQPLRVQGYLKPPPLKHDDSLIDFNDWIKRYKAHTALNAFQTQPIEVQHAALLELLDKELRNKATDTLAGYEPDMPVEAAADVGDARGLLDIVRGIFEASNPIFMRRHTYFNTCLLYTSPSPRD